MDPKPCYPANPSRSLDDHETLLNDLVTADYYRTEAISEELASLARSETIDRLIALASHSTSLARRNAGRVLGNFGHRPAGDPARRLVTTERAADVKAMLLDRFAVEDQEDPLHEIIWVADSLFFPFPETQPFLGSIAADGRFSEQLRFRASNALGRLLRAKTGVLSDADVDLLISLLGEDDIWVRANMGYLAGTLRTDQLSPEARDRVVQALEMAFAAEREWIPRAFIAGALDRYTGTRRREQVRRDLEDLLLTRTVTREDVTARSGLPESRLDELIEHVGRVRSAFFEMLGTSFETPVPNDPNPRATLILFATPDDYFVYTSAFFPSVAHAGGVYFETSAELYTFERPSSQTYTLEQLLAHEFSHYLQGRHVYPGMWSDSGYHVQPKGWADEGLAQLFGGAAYRDDGSFGLPLWASQMRVVCATTPLRPLANLIARREGYSVSGVFDYEFAWALQQYLATEQPEAHRRLVSVHGLNDSCQWP